VEAYRRIRNTFRFILANLYDFDPTITSVNYAELEELDRWVLYQLYQLQQKVIAAYESYEFHAIYHSIHNFCVVILSGFYLDVVKDRLYILQADSPGRRSTQTALYVILDSLVRMCAPILSFTADEIWQYMPGIGEQDSVYLHEFACLSDDYNDPRLAAVWDELLEVRKLVLKQLETARQEKLIGLSLDARLDLAASGKILELLEKYAEQLADIFIVSQVEIRGLPAGEPGISDELPELNVMVYRAAGEKCRRCWRYSVQLTAEDAEFPGICSRCLQQLS